MTIINKDLAIEDGKTTAKNRQLWERGKLDHEPAICQVKDCKNEAEHFVCQHEGGDHEICQECIAKYFTSAPKKEDIALVHRYIINRGWQEVPEDIPTIPQKTEHGDEVQIVEEKEYELYELRKN